MTFETLTALAMYSTAASITPGPNNLMLLASGANFGIRRTVPHALGIGIGFTAMVVIVGLGFGAVTDLIPGFATGLRYASIAYMLWLSYKLATSGSLGSADAGARPMSFWGACLFQWVNPKAWAMALTATALYTSTENYTMSVLMVAAVFGTVNLPCISVWAGFGVALRKILAVPARLRAFNIAMAALLLASTLPFVLA
jgi:threonine/homoserine/homoserine lactone efflux protein